MDDERRVHFLGPCDTKTLSVFKNKGGFKMKQRSFLCALAGVLAVFLSATLGAAQDVTVQGPTAYANVQAYFSSLSQKMPYVLSGRGIGEYYYNRIQLSSFLPDGTRFIKGPLPLAQYFGEPLPSIFAEKTGKTGERIAVGVGWGYGRRKEDGLRGVFLVEYVGDDTEEEVRRILKASWIEAGKGMMTLDEATFDCVAISRVVPKDKKWGYVVASVDVPKLYWKGGDSGQVIHAKP
jgi:pyruvoyl-dependent arginine decarboxylase (PvlArgDC)